MTLPATCDIAFKEWAVICEALAAGRQTIILRKGGIDEGREGFRVRHRDFWLYPTNFHQAADALTPDASLFLEQAAQTRTPAGKVPLRMFASVTATHELTTEEAVAQLAGLHLWSPATVQQRFHYRRPGLFLLLVRIYARPESNLIDESADMAGCKSWVQLPEPLATDGLVPVLSDEAFDARVEAIRAALAPRLADVL